MSWTGRVHGGVEAPAFVVEGKRGEGAVALAFVVDMKRVWRDRGSGVCGGE